MTAFLFIPASSGGKYARRVDFADYASLFAEVEDMASARSRRSTLATRLLAFLLIAVAAIGDTVLVARPYALTHTLQAPDTPAPVARAVTSL